MLQYAWTESVRPTRSNNEYFLVQVISATLRYVAAVANVNPL